MNFRWFSMALLLALLLAQIGARPSRTSTTSREEEKPEESNDMTTSYRIGTEEEGSGEDGKSPRDTFFRLNPDPNPNMEEADPGRRHRDGDEEQEEEGDKMEAKLGEMGNNVNQSVSHYRPLLLITKKLGHFLLGQTLDTESDNNLVKNWGKCVILNSIFGTR